MTERPTVCHVVNSIRDTSMAGDLATKQQKHDNIGGVGILSLFDIKSFRNDGTLKPHCLDVPSNRLTIDRSHYSEAKHILSQYDVVHTHRPHSGFYAKWIANRLNLPMVATHHNNHRGFTWKGRIANSITDAFADRVVSVSESVKQSFAWWERLLIDNENIEVINNGVDINRIDAARTLDWSIFDAADINSDAVVVGSAGMLTEQKAHNVLIEGVDKANEISDQSIELVISGSGGRQAELEAQIADATYDDRLHLLGFLPKREQVYKMMHEIDIYAMSSLWEGFCVAALEAMGIGNACVYSDIPEFRRPFDKVARFHSPNDSAELAREIVNLAADNTFRADLADRARALVSAEYTIQHAVEQYAECYQTIT